MSQSINLSNRFNLKRRVPLPVALGPLVMFAPLLLEDDHFRLAAMVNYRGHHFRALNQRRPNFIGGRHYGQLYRGSDLVLERGDPHLGAWFDAKLFAARLDNRK